MDKVTFNPDVLVAALKSTLPFASKDPTRQHMNRLCVEREGENKVKFVATDGHTLALVTADTLTCALKNNGARYQLTRNEIDLLLLRVKQNKNAPIEIDLAPEENQFPSYQHVIPDYSGAETGPAKIGFNASYLARIEAFATILHGNKRMGAGTRTVSLQFGADNLQPIRCDVSGALGYGTVVIMPERI